MLNLGLNERFDNSLSLENCTQIYFPGVLQLQRDGRLEGGRKILQKQKIYLSGSSKRVEI